MAACPAWSFRGFHVFENALSYVFDIFKDETVEAVTEEQKKAIFFVLSGRDTFVCLLTGYGKSLIYQVAPAKTGLISRGEHHSLSWQFLHMPDRKRFRSTEVSSPSLSCSNSDLCQQGRYLHAQINLHRNYQNCFHCSRNPI